MQCDVVLSACDAERCRALSGRRGRAATVTLTTGATARERGTRARGGGGAESAAARRGAGGGGSVADRLAVGAASRPHQTFTFDRCSTPAHCTQPDTGKIAPSSAASRRRAGGASCHARARQPRSRLGCCQLDSAGRVSCVAEVKVMPCRVSLSTDSRGRGAICSDGQLVVM